MVLSDGRGSRPVLEGKTDGNIPLATSESDSERTLGLASHRPIFLLNWLSISWDEVRLERRAR